MLPTIKFIKGNGKAPTKISLKFGVEARYMQPYRYRKVNPDAVCLGMYYGKMCFKKYKIVRPMIRVVKQESFLFTTYLVFHELCHWINDMLYEAFTKGKIDRFIDAHL